MMVMTASCMTTLSTFRARSVSMMLMMVMMTSHMGVSVPSMNIMVTMMLSSATSSASVVMLLVVLSLDCVSEYLGEHLSDLTGGGP